MHWGSQHLLTAWNVVIRCHHSIFHRKRYILNSFGIILLYPFWNCMFNVVPTFRHITPLAGKRNGHQSVQFSRSIVSNSLWHHGLQHARPPCPSPTPRVYPDSCPLSRWCHPTISFSVIPFSSCPQSFPALESFHMSQLFASGGQSIGVSASTSVRPVNTQHLSPLGWTGWISLQSKGLLLRVFSNTTVQKHQFFNTQLSL